MKYIMLTWVVMITGYIFLQIRKHKNQQEKANQMIKTGLLCNQVPLSNTERLVRWANIYAPRQVIQRGFDFDNSKHWKTAIANKSDVKAGKTNIIRFRPQLRVKE